VRSGRIVDSTQRLLQLLDGRGVQGTFFILGWIAERFPALIHEIRAAGHEIGSHSYEHRLVYQQTPEAFREDLRRSRDVLSEIIGEAVTSYRAPSFSITRESWWALEILVEEGFTVDSSVAPVWHDRYGVADSRPEIHDIETRAGSICEFPPTVLRFGGMRAGMAGGGYFRLFPWGWTGRRIQQYLSASQHPLMFYTHPWEIDDQQPRLQVGSRLSRFRHYVNLPHTMNRLEQLLDTFSFGPMGRVLAEQKAVNAALEGAAL